MISVHYRIKLVGPNELASLPFVAVGTDDGKFTPVLHDGQALRLLFSYHGFIGLSWYVRVLYVGRDICFSV